MFSKIQVKINNLTIGGNAPVRVESMLKIPLINHEACLEQCESLLNSGCELARVAMPDKKLYGEHNTLIRGAAMTAAVSCSVRPLRRSRKSVI